MIRVDRVTKRFDGHVAVSALSFEARDSEVTGLLGVNGAGKTTTLRMIAGVLTPDSGEVRVGGADPLREKLAAQKQIGALLDHTGLYARLTARENLAYFGRLHRLEPTLLGERIAIVIDALGLREIADRPVAGFSQGESMKVALGRALLHQPPHILLDEPTNGLDVPTQKTLRQALDALRDRGACIVFSSHVLADVAELCDRVVVIARGSVVGQGTVEELCYATGTATLEAAFLALSQRGETSHVA